MQFIILPIISGFLKKNEGQIVNLALILPGSWNLNSNICLKNYSCTRCTEFISLILIMFLHRLLMSSVS